MSDILKFDTTTTPITRYEYDDGAWTIDKDQLSVTDPAVEHCLPKNYKEFDELQKVTRMLRMTSQAQILLRHGGRSMVSSFCKWYEKYLKNNVRFFLKMNALCQSAQSMCLMDIKIHKVIS